MRKSMKITTLVGGTALALATAGTAYAYWSTSGSGNGTATTSAGAASLVVTQTSTISNMYPGDSAQTISGTVKNTAANSAYVTSVTASISSVTGPNIDGAHPCGAGDYALAAPVMSVAADVAAGTTVTFTGATLKFANSITNQDGCKGATVNLAYAAA